MAIAGDLNIGVEFLVFADDTDFECDRVWSALPDVGVLNYTLIKIVLKEHQVSF